MPTFSKVFFYLLELLLISPPKKLCICFLGLFIGISLVFDVTMSILCSSVIPSLRHHWSNGMVWIFYMYCLSILLQMEWGEGRRSIK